ncbi:MAG: hypothetical protein KGL39_32475 [Patescibacteria group bacterium]|nr:hypothetical protein [Patescibacteria group bacterium]
MSGKQWMVAVGIVAALIVAWAIWTGGKSAGREETTLDRLDKQVQSLFETRGQLEKRVDELEHWRNRWGKTGNPLGAEAPGK